MPSPTTPPNAQRSATDPRNMPPLSRGAVLVPSTYNADDNTIDVVWTTGSSVRRYDWYNDTMYEEALLVTPEAVDMSRFDAGTVQVLDGHDTGGGVNAIIGIALRGSIENGEGRATLKLSGRPEMAGIVADIIAGIIRAISFGYTVTKYEITRAVDRTDGVNLPLYRAVAWQPHEISFVTVPADADASTRGQPSNGVPCEFITRASAHPITQSPEDNAMPTATEPGAPAAAPTEPNRAAPAAAPAPAAVPALDPAIQAAAQAAVARAAEITDLCTRHNVGNLAAGLIRSGNSVDLARAAVLEELARADGAAGGQRNVRILTLTDEHQTRMAGIEEAMMHRVYAGTKLTDNGRQYRGMSLLEIGRDYLEAQGVSTRGMDRLTLASNVLQFRAAGMHSTSDFANIFANVANKRMRAAYEENQGTYTQWARRAPNAPDFKNISIVQLSAAPDLLRLNEHGEFTYGTMKDAGMSYALVTYGRAVSLTRQAIVNDDLRAFERLVAAFGASSSRLENRLVYSQLTGATVMGDGIALFDTAGHGNLGTGGGSVLQMSALKAGRTAMRLQKGLAKEELNLAPNFLIVPAALEQDAYQLTSSNYVPAKQSDVNEFRAGGRTAVEPIVEPILDAASSSAWFLASSNSQIDTVEYCYLDGAEGPVIESQVGFDTDGVTWKCRLDFAASAIDYRGLYKGAGV